MLYKTLVKIASVFDEDGFHKTADVIDDVLKRKYKHPLFENKDMPLSIPVEPDVRQFLRKPGNNEYGVKGVYSPSNKSLFLNQYGYDIIDNVLNLESGGVNSDMLKRKLNPKNDHGYVDWDRPDTFVRPEDKANIYNLLKYHKVDDPYGLSVIPVNIGSDYSRIMDVLSHEMLHGKQRNLGNSIGKDINRHLNDKDRLYLQQNLPKIELLNKKLEPYYNFDRFDKFRDDTKGQHQFVEQMPHSTSGSANERYFTNDSSVVPFLYAIGYLHAIAKQHGIERAIEFGQTMGAAGRLALEQVLKDYGIDAPKDWAKTSDMFEGQLPETQTAPIISIPQNKLTPEEQNVFNLLRSNVNSSKLGGIKDKITPNVIQSLVANHTPLDQTINLLLKTKPTEHTVNAVASHPELINDKYYFNDFIRQFKNQLLPETLQLVREYNDDNSKDSMSDWKQRFSPFLFTDKTAFEMFGKELAQENNFGAIARYLDEDKRLLSYPNLDTVLMNKIQKSLANIPSDDQSGWEISSLGQSVKKIPGLYQKALPVVKSQFGDDVLKYFQMNRKQYEDNRYNEVFGVVNYNGKDYNFTDLAKMFNAPYSILGYYLEKYKDINTALKLWQEKGEKGLFE